VKLFSDYKSRRLALRMLRFQTTLNSINQVDPTHARVPKAIERAGLGRGRVKALIGSEKPNEPQGKPAGFRKSNTLTALGQSPDRLRSSTGV